MAKYAETAALIEVMGGDLDAARRRLAEFLPGELSEFYDQTSTLLDLIFEARRDAEAPESPAEMAVPGGEHS